jgi:hypothetical protein
LKGRAVLTASFLPLFSDTLSGLCHQGQRSKPVKATVYGWYLETEVVRKDLRKEDGVLCKKKECYTI